MTYQEMVEQFYREKAGRVPLPSEAYALVTEERLELERAWWRWCGSLDTAELLALVKEAQDLQYTLHGLMIALGVDGDRAFRLVHESNMTKQPTDAGKVQKGPDYVPPDLSGCIR